MMLRTKPSAPSVSCQISSLVFGALKTAASVIFVHHEQNVNKTGYSEKVISCLIDPRMTDPYDRYAERFFTQYQSLSFEQVHSAWRAHLPSTPGFALDVGAGSGRDAAALAALGWDVLAVEPAAGLRSRAAAATTDTDIQWLDDELPELRHVRGQSYRFDLILVSAVWMHVPPAQRERSFRILTELLAPGGILVITLRHGPDDAERTFHRVSRDELEALGRKRALVTLHAARDSDRLQRTEVWWETVVFRLPDDGSGALPVLRHVIVNDGKSSTYKLGLLRTLTRIADSLPGMVLQRDDNWVEVPLGLVALYWIKLYQPLVLRHRLRQAPGSKGYGFAKASFYALTDVSPYDLRVGRQLDVDLGGVLLKAIRDAARNIAEMPAQYTRWPGSELPIFEVDVQPWRRVPGSVQLDKETLSLFGRFKVPSSLWDCFSRYACWIEPAILNEWIDLMQGYEGRDNSDVYHTALRWEEGQRDTSLVRRMVESQVADKNAVHCVWTAADLRRRQFDIDHCFPWSRWNNNDLWNLLPTTSQANSAKGDRLPAAPLLRTARSRILQWWEEAYLASPQRTQFFLEAEAALPMAGEEPTLERVFEGVMHQRLRLKMNQQLAEWNGLSR